MNDSIQVTGKVKITKNGVVVQDSSNMVVTTGKEWVALRLRGLGSPISHMAIGTGTTAAAVGDITVENQYGSRISSTVNPGTVSTSIIVYSYFPITSTVSITEAGTFTAATAGTMISRVKFPKIDCVNGDYIGITWELEIG